MRKIGLFILAGFLIFSNMGCGKKETAQEIMKKVQNKSAELVEKAEGLCFSMDGNAAISMQGITIKPKFQMNLNLDHFTNSSEFKGNMQINAEIMNEKFQMDAWMTDKLMYTDINGELGIESFDLSELTSQSSAITKYFENQNLEEFYKDFKVDKTKNGYVLTREQTDFSSVLNMIRLMMTMGSGSLENQAALDILQSFDIKKMIITVNVSEDYILDSENLKLEMEMEVEGQKLGIELDVDFAFEFTAEESVQLPDLSKWTIGSQRASCVIEQAGLMTMNVDLSATNDEIDKMNMKIAIDSSLFGGVDFSTLDDESKAQVQDMMMEQLGLSEDTKGLTTTVEFTDTMIVNVAIDLKVASREDLNKIGLDLDNADLSFKRFIQSSKDEGYTCTVN